MTDREVTLRITLGEMKIDESFWVTIPLTGTTTVNDLLDAVFPASATESSAIEESLDVRANPDLPAMYGELRELIARWREGAWRVDFNSSSGDPVQLTDPVARYLRSTEGRVETLELVLDQRLDALDAYQQNGGSPEDLVQWMQGCVLIYFMDKHRYRLPTQPEENTEDWLLLPIADELEELAFIATPATGGPYEITRKGRGFIGNLIAETESYIRRFDAFSDVLPGRGFQPTTFGSGRGIDLRVQIFEVEGIDPYRAVFLLRMYDGTLDGYADCWREKIRSAEFLNLLLEPVVDHQRVGDVDIDRIIDHGLDHIEKVAESHKSRSRGGRLRSRTLAN